LNYGGWGFNLDGYSDPTAPPCDGCPNGSVKWPTDKANAIVDTELKTKPFFRRGGPLEEILVPGDAGNAAAVVYKQRILAESFPAVTSAVGMNFVNNFEDNNLNMQSNFKTRKGDVVYWPEARADNTNWKHSDVKNVAYIYVYSLFDNLVQIGGLK